MSLRCTLTVLCLVLLVVQPTPALAEGWVVVPVVVGGTDDAVLVSSRAAASVSAALATRASVLAPVTARERFETRGTSAPIAATHSDIDEIGRDAQQALYHVAAGLYATATTDVERVMVRANRALESLNRESLSARQLLDACLYIVRARLEAKKTKEAREQALECRRLVPDIEPDASMHPPDVIGELAAAEATMEMQSPGSLRVTSEPSACPVFVQGRNLGQTPLELPKLSRGEYRVQVECVPGEYGRVHRVTLGPSRTTVHVDAHFDGAVQSSDGVSLRYTALEASHRYAGAHAVEVGRVVGVKLTALITPDPVQPQAVRITALEVESGTLRAAVRTTVGTDGAIEHGAEVAKALTEGHSLDFTQTPPAPFVDDTALDLAAISHAPTDPTAKLAVAPDDSVDRGERTETPVLGYVLAGTGAAAYLAGWALYGQLLALDADYRKVRELPDLAEAERRLASVEDFEAIPLVTSLAGSAVLAGSLPLWLPPSERSWPVGAIVTGAAGVVAAGAGTYLLVRGAACKDFDRLGRCDAVPLSTRLGVLMLSTAVPLLTVPVVYALRGGEPREAPEVSLEVGATRAMLSWRGKL